VLAQRPVGRPHDGVAGVLLAGGRVAAHADRVVNLAIKRFAKAA
jgi:hypothetical protein